MVEYLRVHPEAVQAWHQGWPRCDQPNFQTLLETASQIEVPSTDGLRFFANVLHKMIHPDPAGALWNMITREDGELAFSSGRILDDPAFCDFVSVTGSRFLSLVTRAAEIIFGREANGT